MSIETICSILLATLSFFSFGYAIWQTIRKKRQGANASEVNAELTKQLEEHNKRLAVFDKVAQVVNEAENVFTGVRNPVAKLNYAITKLQIACVEQGVVIPEEELAAQIEKYLTTPQKKNLIK